MDWDLVPGEGMWSPVLTGQQAYLFGDSGHFLCMDLKGLGRGLKSMIPINQS